MRIVDAQKELIEKGTTLLEGLNIDENYVRINRGPTGLTPLLAEKNGGTFRLSPVYSPTAESALAGIAALIPVGPGPAPSHKTPEPQLSCPACGTYLRGRNSLSPKRVPKSLVSNGVQFFLTDGVQWSTRELCRRLSRRLLISPLPTSSLARRSVRTSSRWLRLTRNVES